jgi:hypothetical protein
MLHDSMVRFNVRQSMGAGKRFAGLRLTAEKALPIKGACRS